MEELLNQVISLQSLVENTLYRPAVSNAARALQRTLLEEAMASVDNGGNFLSLNAKEKALAVLPNNKIPAIQAYRKRTGQGLKESKDAVEAWMMANLGRTSVPLPGVATY